MNIFEILERFNQYDYLVLQEINASPGTTPLEIAQEAVIPQASVYRAIYKLIEFKFIKKYKRNFGSHVYPLKKIEVEVSKVPNS